jgi:hypothetical protein
MAEPGLFAHPRFAGLRVDKSAMTGRQIFSAGKRVTESNLTIWGRANSVNVQKVLWCAAELELSYRRIDAGMAFGRNTEPDISR